MTPAPEKEAQFVRYLFGQLPEEERAALEESYFSNDEVFERLLAADAELLDAYVRGDLTPEEKRNFEKTLGSPRRREKVELARALRQVASTRRPEAPVRPSSLPGLLRLAAALLLAAGGLWFAAEAWRLRGERGVLAGQRAALEERIRRVERLAEESRRRAETLERELTQARNRIEPPVRETPGRAPEARTVSFLLTAGLLREGPGTNQLRIPQDAREIVLELPLEGPAADASYRAHIERVSGQKVWSQGGLQPHLHRGITSVPVRIPSDRLTRGDSIVRLEAVDATGVEVVAEFVFRILR